MVTSNTEAAELKKVAANVRKKWIDRLNSGQVDIRTLMEYSKRDNEDKYIAQIRLLSILTSRSDWSKSTALEVLKRHSFTDKTTVRTLRSAPIQAEKFEAILKTAAGRWRGRPEPPKGWPWSGKLSLLIQNANEEVPDELLALMDDDGELDEYEGHLAADENGELLDPALLELMGDDDDDEEQ